MSGESGPDTLTEKPGVVRITRGRIGWVATPGGRFLESRPSWWRPTRAGAERRAERYLRERSSRKRREANAYDLVLFNGQIAIDEHA